MTALIHEPKLFAGCFFFRGIASFGATGMLQIAASPLSQIPGPKISSQNLVWAPNFKN